MKVKTSVTLSEELLHAISSETNAENRSAFIETATWEYLEIRKRHARDRHDATVLEENIDLLNREARETLEYQDDG